MKGKMDFTRKFASCGISSYSEDQSHVPILFIISDFISSSLSLQSLFHYRLFTKQLQILMHLQFLNKSKMFTKFTHLQPRLKKSAVLLNSYVSVLNVTRLRIVKQPEIRGSHGRENAYCGLPGCEAAQSCKWLFLFSLLFVVLLYRGCLKSTRCQIGTRNLKIPPAVQKPKQLCRYRLFHNFNKRVIK